MSTAWKPTGLPTPSALSAGRMPPAKRGRKLSVVRPHWARKLLQKYRYKGIESGRGGGKSHEVMELMLLFMVKNPNLRIVFIREVQKSLKESVKQLLEQKIKDLGLEKYFNILTTEIRAVKGDGVFLFIGMNDNTAVTIKSLEGIGIAILEEAQQLSNKSIRTLRPTIRKEGAEIWALWNPQNRTDPIDVFFFGEPDEDADKLREEEFAKNGFVHGAAPSSVVIRTNFTENRHASETMKADAKYDYERDPAMAEHIWGGKYETHSEARIFKHVRIEHFDIPPDIMKYGGWRLGADWGFSIDPLVLLAGWVDGRKVYIRYEAYERGVQIKQTKAHFLQVPVAAAGWPIIAGRDRPDRILHAQDEGFNIKACVGGNNSEIAGVDYLKDYEIIIHPECKHAKDEFLNYKHPIDKMTGKVIPVLPTKRNHVVEAGRYMIEDIRRFEERRPAKPPPNFQRPVPIKRHWPAAGARRQAA